MNSRQGSIFQPPYPQKPGEIQQWGKLYGSALGLATRELVEQHEGLVLIISTSSMNAQALNEQIYFYFHGSEYELLNFPDWETLPYDVFSPHQDITSERLETLYRLPSINHGLLIVPVQTLLHRIVPFDYVTSRSFIYRNGQSCSQDSLRKQLIDSGYEHVSTVMEHGEFAIRGSIIDLFPTGSLAPFRIELFDDEVESIRTFDPETQRTIKQAEEIRMLPAREFPLDEEGIRRFRQSYRAQFEGDPNQSVIYREVSDGRAPAGIEYYIPLFFEKTQSLFDYLPDNTLVLFEHDILQQANEFHNDISERFESARHDIQRPVLRPDQLFIQEQELVEALNRFPYIEWQRHEHEAASAINFDTKAPPQLLINARAPLPTQQLSELIAGTDARILFTAESTGRRETLLGLLRDNQISPVQFETWSEFLNSSAKLGITVAPLEQGLFLNDPALYVITETQLFGQQVYQRRRRSRQQRDSENIVKNLAELTIGAPVVHEEYGVGRFLGLQTITTGDFTTEFLTLEYADHDKLYVPVSSLQLISRYTGASPETAPLHKLGSGQWERARKKAQERIRDVAAELLEIYAKREAKQGYSYDIDENQYRAFASEFPFEETPDQQTAIDNVIRDMQSPKPMDHLVCGDVGFGKTEVAMRAAFIAVMAGKQVAVLTPTTLLTQQHYQTFSDRFSEWPVKIDSLSRFRSKKEQDNIIKQLGEGKIDIVIGTHKLLQKEIKYKALGLVIIDEEHRFGVRQKETFKHLRSEIDILTLTATPIPRTLNMSMSGMRDLSIISTPPAKRLAIKTFISQWNDRLMLEAITRELKRGGQVFYVHNEVETIEKEVNKIRNLIPNVKIEFAHGQMRERELEQVMSNFYHQRFNILVCTTIIETGIDIPNANTIIINRADRFGLAQLYQLRGRVGRSHHRAYAYLVIPDKNVMTSDAQKRLEAIESIETLGTGFTLATHDLEIRGAGELLGDEQSGQIQEIGYSMYTELLERAVKSLKEGKSFDIAEQKKDIEIKLHIPALIPEDYLPDVHERLILYKRIASATNEDELSELQVEMIDRFGLLPQPIKNLFEISSIRNTAKQAGIIKIDLGDRGGYLLFDETPNIDTAVLIDLIQNKSNIYRLDGKTKLKIQYQSENEHKRMTFIRDLLEQLMNTKEPEASFA
jgi:transcription-repair coupling factor (superfamily II helicase)